MTTRGFVVTHASEAKFDHGLRASSARDDVSICLRAHELGHSDDLELLELVMPGEYKSAVVPSVDG